MGPADMINNFGYKCRVPMGPVALGNDFGVFTKGPMENSCVLRETTPGMFLNRSRWPPWVPMENNAEVPSGTIVWWGNNNFPRGPKDDNFN